MFAGNSLRACRSDGPDRARGTLDTGRTCWSRVALRTDRASGASFTLGALESSCASRSGRSGCTGVTLRSCGAGSARCTGLTAKTLNALKTRSDQRVQWRR